MPHYIWAGRPSFTIGSGKELKVQLFILHMGKLRHSKLSELFKTMQQVSERIISVPQCMFEEEVAEEMGASFKAWEGPRDKRIVLLASQNAVRGPAALTLLEVG